MKKLILLLSAIIILVSCQARCPLRTNLTPVSLINNATTSCQPVTLGNLIRQFQFDPSAIYGDVFGNKAWH